MAVPVAFGCLACGWRRVLAERVGLLLASAHSVGANTIEERDVWGVRPRLDVLLAVSSSRAFDLVEVEKRLRVFGALDEFFKAIRPGLFRAR